MFDRVLNMPLNLMFSFFMTLSNASKFAGVHYHRKAPTVESFSVKLLACSCDFTNERTLSQLFFREFYRVFHNDFFER